MELGIPNAPAIGIAPERNSGYAVVLDQSTFDPNAFMTNLITLEQQQRALAKKDALENKAKWAKFKFEDIVPAEVYYSNQAEITEQVEAFSEIMADAAARGLDPDSAEFKAQAAPIIMKLKMLSNEGKQLEDNYSQMTAKVAADPTKYNPDALVEFNKGYAQQTTLKDRKNYFYNNNPYQELFDPVKYIKDLGLKEEITKVATGNGTFQETGALNRGDVKGLIEKTLLNPQDNQWDDVYAEGVKAGAWDSPDKFVDYYTEVAMGFGQVTNKESGKEGSSTYVNYGQGTEEGTTWDFADITDKGAYPGLKVSPKNFMGIKNIVGKKKVDYTPITLKPDKGQAEQVVPIGFYAAEGPNGQVFGRIKAKKFSSRTTQRVFKKEDESGASAFLESQKQAGDVAASLKEDNGQYVVEFHEAEDIYMPMSPENKVAFPASVQQEFDKWITSFGASTGGASTFNKQK
jgi:hypothetical protein